MPSSRRYDNSGRQAKAKETADRIVGALCELVIEEPAATISIPLVAERASVSVRTVYSHFPTKEALFEAITPYIQQRFAAHQGRPIAELAEFSDVHQWVRGSVAFLADSIPFFQALQRAGIENEDFARRRAADQIALWEQVLAREVDLPADQLRLLAITVNGLVSHPVIARFARSGQTTEATADALDWAVHALMAQAATTPITGT